MAWWSLGRNRKDKHEKKKPKQHGGNNVSQHVQQRNAEAMQYSEAMKRLQSKTLTVEERYADLVKTFRKGKDLMIVPTSWMGRDLIVNCPCRKIYVDTPVPSIVRTR